MTSYPPGYKVCEPGKEKGIWEEVFEEVEKTYLAYTLYRFLGG